MKSIVFFIFVITALLGDDLNFKSLKGDFTQIISSNETVATYSGEFYAKSDNKALWIYNSPSKKMIYFSDHNVVVVDDELEQAIISKLQNSVNLVQVLSTAKRITQNIYKAIYDDVEYLITLKDGLPFVVDYKDKLENKIKITFKNISKDINISDELLFPKIPKGYDIITQ